MSDIFVRPSRDGLRKIQGNLSMVERFIAILDERAGALSVEHSRLQSVIREKEEEMFTKKIKLTSRLDGVYKRHGLLDLMRLGLTGRDNLRVSLRKDSILGVEYNFPVAEGSDPSFIVSEGGLALNSLCDDMADWFDCIVDLSKYKEAERTLSLELRSVRRKLNVLRNIILVDELAKKARVERILEERERSAWVSRKLVIDAVTRRTDAESR